MNSEPSRSQGTASLEWAVQIDRICDAYESSLASGRSSRIEDFLDGVPEVARARLLRELLALDLEWRRCHGEQPAAIEYLERFPAEETLVHAAFAEEPAPRSIRSTRPVESSGSREGDESPASLEPGAEPLPGYPLVERLGRGGFGEVWKAEGPGGVLVALKFVPLTSGQGVVETRALEIIKKIRHPNLLALFGAWQVGGYLIIGMELADCALVDRLRQVQAERLAGIPGLELIEYLGEAAKGIDHLNEHIHTLEGRERIGVQHRDIKPQNILLIGGGVKVADFGLARLLEQAATEHSGSLTPSFAAPEFFHNRTSDHSDQYSLAVTYCYLRGGRLPFTGGPAALMGGHLFHPPDLSMLPESEHAVVLRALAKEPGERWPSCRSFVANLQGYLGSNLLAKAEESPTTTWESLGDDSKHSPALPRSAPGDHPLNATSSGRVVGPAPFPLLFANVPSLLPRPRRFGLLTMARLLGFNLAGLTLAAWIVSLMIHRDPPALPSVPGDLPTSAAKPNVRTGGSTVVDRTLKPIRSHHGSGPTQVPLLPRRHDSVQLANRPVESLDNSREASRFVDEGNHYLSTNQYGDAILSFAEALQLDRSNVTALNGQGNAYLKLGHADDAVSSYTEAIKHAPLMAECYYNRGNAYMALNRYDDAIVDYTEAIKHDSSNPNAYFNRAIAHEKRGELGEAARDRAKASQLESP